LSQEGVVLVVQVLNKLKNKITLLYIINSLFFVSECVFFYLKCFTFYEFLLLTLANFSLLLLTFALKEIKELNERMKKWLQI